MVNNTLITLRVVIQKSISLSSMEAEYMAMCENTKEAMYLRSLLKDLQHEQTEKTIIYEDNDAARFLSKALEYLAVVASLHPLSSHSASMAASYFLRACAPPGSTDRLRKAPAPTPPNIQSLSSSHATLSSICAECGETRKKRACCRMWLAANNSIDTRASR